MDWGRGCGCGAPTFLCGFWVWIWVWILGGGCGFRGPDFSVLDYGCEFWVWSLGAGCGRGCDWWLWWVLQNKSRWLLGRVRYFRDRVGVGGWRGCTRPFVVFVSLHVFNVLSFFLFCFAFLQCHGGGAFCLKRVYGFVAHRLRFVCPSARFQFSVVAFVYLFVFLLTLREGAMGVAIVESPFKGRSRSIIALHVCIVHLLASVAFS